MTSIIDALKLLEPTNDGHWTADGLPRVDVLAEMVGDKALKRGDVTKAAPTFTRENPTTEVVEALEKDEEQDVFQPVEEIGAQAKIKVKVVQEDLDEQLRVAKEQLIIAQALIDEAQSNYSRVVQKIDDLIEIAESNKKPNENQLAIVEFLAGQQRLREQRAGIKTPVDQVLTNRKRVVRPVAQKAE
jgi:acid stress-induced BolA-like protein IbaG/YrbA